MVAKSVLGADFYYQKANGGLNSHPQILADPALFDLTIGQAMKLNAAASDNNIFH